MPFFANDKYCAPIKLWILLLLYEVNVVIDDNLPWSSYFQLNLINRSFRNTLNEKKDFPQK